jgi:hypothetical protein
MPRRISTRTQASIGLAPKTLRSVLEGDFGAALDNELNVARQVTSRTAKLDSARRPGCVGLRQAAAENIRAGAFLESSWVFLSVVFLTTIRQWRVIEASGADRDFHLYEAEYNWDRSKVKV